MSDKEIIAQQAQQISELQASLRVALARIAELEAMLGQNSRNSSRPPSSDGFKKQPAFLRSSGKRVGGQPGHRGDTLKMVAQADQVVFHRVDEVCNCGHDLSQILGQVRSRRQVFDLPVQSLVVTEHQSECKVCPHCGQVNLQGKSGQKVKLRFCSGLLSILLRTLLALDTPVRHAFSSAGRPVPLY